MDIVKPRPVRGRVPVALAVLTAGLLAFHRAVPNTPGRAGSLLESFLPWLGLAAVLLFLYGLWRRTPVVLVAALLPVAVWTHLFAGLLLPADAAGPRDLVVVQHNVSDDNPDPADTARALAGTGADLIALEELVPDALPAYERVLAARYPHHEVRGTVGLWSRYPLSGARTVDIKPAEQDEPWSRGLRAVAATPHGQVAVYVAHLPSVRIVPSGMTSRGRDESAVRLGREVEAEPLDRVILLGDLNSTVDDRGLAPLTSRLEVPRHGFAFSFPAGLPLVRIDQVMARSATVSGIDTLPATGSDHLPVRARISLD
ncbi:endonuclease/exonuclease/phosphatase family protein [Streptomyces cellulosae]|uniref:endonuclease/exonuclease/phosphatase family protein n=1 Tax=unclassified Streptomyces TaxID=2593676 RepID=UPI00037403F2|nr:endonuclease/exonuclease/phosphatase family protein [Streptomyces cellulosae]WSB94506.1 endonuclease/exonuclease/phosphatase family protein [Streptomyces cellulosae]